MMLFSAQQCWSECPQEEMTGLIEPINTRVTDPNYFLNSPHQGKTDGGAPDAPPTEGGAFRE